MREGIEMAETLHEMAVRMVGCKDCKIKFLRESKFSLINGHPVFSNNGYDECIDAWNRRASDD